jgi:hypothetical protein
LGKIDQLLPGDGQEIDPGMTRAFQATLDSAPQTNVLIWKSANKSKVCDGTPSTPGPRASRLRDAVERILRSVYRSTLHGATRTSGASAPEQGWPVLDGARRPEGRCHRPPN